VFNPWETIYTYRLPADSNKGEEHMIVHRHLLLGEPLIFNCAVARQIHERYERGEWDRFEGNSSNHIASFNIGKKQMIWIVKLTRDYEITYLMTIPNEFRKWLGLYERRFDVIEVDDVSKNDRRYKEVEDALKKGFIQLIETNWDGIERYMDEYEIMGECLFIEFLNEKAGIHFEIAGIEYPENYDGCPDNWISLKIPLNDGITKDIILEYNVVEKSRYWENQYFLEDLEEFHVEYGE